MSYGVSPKLYFIYAFAKQTYIRGLLHDDDTTKNGYTYFFKFCEMLGQIRGLKDKKKHVNIDEQVTMTL